MRYADYYDCDICNGNQVGMSLFVTGCNFHCEGCFNSSVWSFDSGNEWTPVAEDRFLGKVGRDYIKRVSFLGGEPLCDENIFDVSKLIFKIKEQYDDKKIWVYTGYTWEELIDDQPTGNPDSDVCKIERRRILANVDVVVDGRFIVNRKDLSLAFRGSDNQRIIDVKRSLSENKLVLWGR